MMMRFKEFYLLFSKAHKIMQKAQSINSGGCEIIYCDAKAQFDLLSEMFSKDGWDMLTGKENTEEMQAFLDILIEQPQLLKGNEKILLFWLTDCNYFSECANLQQLLTLPQMCGYYYQRAKDDDNIEFMQHLLEAVKMEKSFLDLLAVQLQKFAISPCEAQKSLINLFV